MFWRTFREKCWNKDQQTSVEYSFACKFGENEINIMVVYVSSPDGGSAQNHGFEVRNKDGKIILEFCVVIYMTEQNTFLEKGSLFPSQ